ncbi:MAG: type B 50S ribosomal protein L31 [Gemmatimonadetes bacterium]|nr:type B 50S ribosomal protein L31 [Gemmatimonadota bacterium]
MKKDIHPDYRPVVFQDVSTGYSFLTRSTVTTDRTIQWEDGNEYPLLTLEISSSSHPFYTGTQRLLDSAGRVERFERRYARGKGGGAKADAASDAEAPAAEAAADEGDAPSEEGQE